MTKDSRTLLRPEAMPPNELPKGIKYWYFNIISKLLLFYLQDWNLDWNNMVAQCKSCNRIK